MKDVRINKERLLETLKENKDAHEEAFHEASAEFYKKFAQDLEHASELVNGREANYSQALRILQAERPPQGHCDEYERQIRMLEFEEDSIVVLTPDEFTRFVLDEWHWKEEFATSYMNLTKKSLRGTVAS